MEDGGEEAGNSVPNPVRALALAFWHKSLMSAGLPHINGRSRFKIKTTPRGPSANLNNETPSKVVFWHVREPSSAPPNP